MTGPVRGVEDRCRHCGRFGFEAHRQDCPQAPDEPFFEEPPVEPDVADRAASDYENRVIGEYPQ
jgi:hypothetical protein